MHGSGQKGLQNQKVKRSLQKVSGWRHSTPLDVRQQVYATSCRLSRGRRVESGQKRRKSTTGQKAVGSWRECENVREWREWWPGTGLNRRRRPFQGRALPLSYLASVQTFGCMATEWNPAGPEKVGWSTCSSLQQLEQYINT